MSKRVILLGGGASIEEGINKGLWNNIKGEEIWSLNYAFLTMPYLPQKEVWVDNTFFSNNKNRLENLAKQGVNCIAKYSTRYVAIDDITCYHTVREKDQYKGRDSIKEDKVFKGKLGLVGTFALSVAVCGDFDEISLLGYDFGVLTTDDRKTHYYQDMNIDYISSGAGNPNVYLKNVNTPKNSVHDYDVYKEEYDRIFNVSLRSNIDTFKKISYDTFFKQLRS